MNTIQSSYHSSAADKSEVEAKDYTKTHQSSHRYLAYRDIPIFIQKYLGSNVSQKLALDYGAGTGYSTEYLHQQGFNAVGVDVSQEMLQQARFAYPDLSFHEAVEGEVPLESSSCEFIFSSFVLFELSSKEAIIRYLGEVRRLLTENGIFVALTGSKDLHSPSKNWLNFDSRFQQNQELSSGKEVKLLLKDLNIEFTDYYWTEEDYQQFFLEAGLEIVECHYPLGRDTDPYSWNDEMKDSPYLIIIAKLKD